MPWEFFNLTPRELFVMAGVIGDHEHNKEREMWMRFAFLAAETINISGKTVRHPVKARNLIRFEGEAEWKPWTKEQIEARKRQAMETAKLHKSKFWKKLKDESVRKVTEN